MKHHARKKGEGFTLIEILIALTLFSLILVMIFSGLYSSGKSWHAGNNQSEANDDQRLILGFIRKQIMQTVPLLFIDGKDNRIIFRGDADKLQFVSRLPAHRGGSDLYLLTLMTARQDKTSSMILDYVTITPEMELFDGFSSEHSKKTTLLENIERLEFSYFGRKKDDKEPAWYEQWQNQETLPTLLQLQIIPERDNTYWPELLIPIHSRIEKGQPQLTLHKPKAFGERG